MTSVQSALRTQAAAVAPAKANLSKAAKPAAKAAAPLPAMAPVRHAPDLGLYNRLGQSGAGAAPIGAARTVSTPAPKASTAAQDSARAGGFVAGGGPVTVDILNSDSGYENTIYWSSDNFATRHRLGTDNHTGSVVIGNFAAGTQIDFAIVNGVNQFFRTGAAASNSDNFEHTRSEATAQGLQIGFEDLAGGGDRDFNDAIIRVRGVAPPAPPPNVGAGATAAVDTVAAGTGASADAKARAANADNRSGLGDGSNPGQGAGRVNSPNAGTLNPNQAGAMTAKASVAPVLAAPGAKPASAAKAAATAAAKPAARTVSPPAAAATAAAATATAAAAASNKQLLSALYAGVASAATKSSAGAPR